ncbi:MAG: glycerol kinase GlpK [Phycisphaerae bacterium]|nr:glycerol kinase GlpK [Phycisphaerae bacterium]
MKYILAIDQSTSATKAILFDTTGAVVDKASVSHPQHYPRPGWVEHDAEELFANTLTAIRQVMDRQRGKAADIGCLSITNQRETFVVFDRKTGKPLHRAIVWQCRRGDEICAALRREGHEDRIRRLTGLKIDSYFPAAKIRWLLEAKPDIRKALQTGKALVGTIDAYLVHRLTGGRVFATDSTNASRTLLFDIHRMRWDEGLCELFAVPVGALPEVRDSDGRYGETDGGGAIGRAVPICGVMGDSQASLFAHRCYTPGSAKVTFGTGSSILLNVGDQPRHSAGGTVTTVAWVVARQAVYAFEGIIHCTGATIAWLKDQLALIADPAETETLARGLSDNGGVYLVPAFVGLGAPYWNQDARAAIVGLTQHSTRAHVARAALESIAYQIKDALDDMAAEAGTPLDAIRGDGGMVANRFLMQFVADVLRIPVVASQVAELSPLGAALAGAVGMGVYKGLADLAKLDLGTVEYAPAMDARTAAAYVEGWKHAVRRVLL